MYLVTDSSSFAYPDLDSSLIYVELPINIFTEVNKATQEGCIDKIKEAGGQVSHPDLQIEMFVHVFLVFLHFAD